MRILDRYLAGAVIGGTLLTLAVLLPLLAFFLLADEMDHVGTHNYRFADAALFVTLSLPRYAYQVFPIATLIGALVGLGTLAGRSELVAMRAAGVSVGRIVLGAMLGGLLLAILAVAMGEALAPPAERHALTMRQAAKTGDTMQLTESGLWARDGDSFINIREVKPGAELRDISIYRVSGTELVSATHARAATYRDGMWMLEGIERSHVSAEGVRVERIDEAGWNSLLDPDLLKLIVAEPHALSVLGLYRYVRYMQQSEQDGDRYQVALWAKLVHPFLILAMIFVSTPILLGSARSSGLGVKIFFGIVIGIAFYLVSRSFAYFALLYGFDPALAALLPPLLFVAGALLLLRRAG
ncbi:LPS export ABC transporter permease LptG [Thiohalocapsa marina]|uniref:LPS export ABC transporter permease LptG n=1 Tax=Thiohalocapsa marina TaxID=424902 RepID=A0A5M8FL43_9GAMM|nr:LPS export ABC transporter permease LptG [Thiohalocapsa marina]KAA6185633.1 LPS export ABC transporter permease LptG [Thiohalocapsa marina]